MSIKYKNHTFKIKLNSAGDSPYAEKFVTASTIDGAVRYGSGVENAKFNALSSAINLNYGPLQTMDPAEHNNVNPLCLTLATSLGNIELKYVHTKTVDEVLKQHKDFITLKNEITSLKNENAALKEELLSTKRRFDALEEPINNSIAILTQLKGAVEKKQKLKA